MVLVTLRIEDMFLYTKKWIVLSFYIINMLVCFSGIFTSDIILEF